MKTGIVLEIENGKARVLKNNGEFLEVKAQMDWKKGDVIVLKQRSFSMKGIYMAAACIVFLIAAVRGYAMVSIQDSIISLDINPSIEIQLNRFNRVISFKALNEDGENIIQELDLKNQKLQDALKCILEEEGLEGYFNNSGNLVFTVFSKNTKKEQALLDEIKNITEEALLTRHSAVAPEYHGVNEATVKEAHNLNVTAGKYLYLQQLYEADSGINMEEYCHHSIDQLKEEISHCKDSSKKEHHVHE